MSVSVEYVTNVEIITQQGKGSVFPLHTFFFLSLTSFISPSALSMVVERNYIYWRSSSAMQQPTTTQTAELMCWLTLPFSQVELKFFTMMTVLAV